MSAQMPGEGRPTPASPPRRGLSNRRFFVMVLPAVVLVVLLAVIFLPFGASAVIQLVPPDAVRVSASVADDGRTLVTHEITDARTVADLYARLNRLPAAGVRFGCGLGVHPDPVRYTFHFTRWGVPVEDATPEASGCATRRWTVSHGVLSEVRMDYTGEQTPAMLAEAHLPPLPSQP